MPHYKYFSPAVVLYWFLKKQIAINHFNNKSFADVLFMKYEPYYIIYYHHNLFLLFHFYDGYVQVNLCSQVMYIMKEVWNTVNHIA